MTATAEAPTTNRLTTLTPTLEACTAATQAFIDADNTWKAHLDTAHNPTIDPETRARAHADAHAAFKARQDANHNQNTLWHHRYEAFEKAAPSLVPEHDLGDGFSHAVRTAIGSIPIIERVTIPEARCGFLILRVDLPTGSTRFEAVDGDAFTPPTEAPLLPWSAPRGTVVARVGMDGSVALV